MSENNEVTSEVNTFIEVKPTYEALELMTQELSNSVDRWKSMSDSYEARLNRLATQNGDAANYILENVDSDWKDHAIEIMERLGQDTTTTKRYTVTLTALVTVEAELGKDIDLSDWDFDVDRLTISSNENGYEVTDTEDIEITDVSEY
jgi:CYTH domain-containing protein